MLLGSKIPPSPADALPTQTFAATRRIDANGDQLMLGKIPNAHTDTDIYIKFQKANVLHLGDVFFNGMYPFIDATTGGSISGMIDGVELLDEAGRRDDEDRARPRPARRSEGADAAFATCWSRSRDRVAKLKKSGQTLQQVVAAAPTKDLDAMWGKGFLQPNDFVALVYNTL